MSQRNTFSSELFSQSIFFLQHEAKKLKLWLAAMESEYSRGNSVCLHSVRKPETFLKSWVHWRIYSSLGYDVYGAVNRFLHVFQFLCRHRPQLCVILLLPQRRALHLYWKAQFEYYVSFIDNCHANWLHSLLILRPIYLSHIIIKNSNKNKTILLNIKALNLKLKFKY